MMERKMPTSYETWTASALFCRFIKADCSQCPNHIFYGLHKALADWDELKCHMPYAVKQLEEKNIPDTNINTATRLALLSYKGLINEKTHYGASGYGPFLRFKKAKNGQMHFKFTPPTPGQSCL
jgi:hypothetical protein